MQTTYELNKIITDDFGRKHGVIAVNKPLGITSHDIVYKLRKVLGTKKVGHAGALDPEATGVMIMLIGHATKLSDKILTQDKEYKATILFGIKTDSGDREGKILEMKEADEVPELAATLSQFSPSYEQFVPVFSSVKIDGEKLRVLARKADRFEVVDEGDKRIATFYKGESITKVELPKHKVELPVLEILSAETIDLSASEFYQKNKDSFPSPLTRQPANYPTVTVRVGCSKGTYIRTLAEDIGAALPTPLPAMLWQLERTKVGEAEIAQAIPFEELESLVN